MVAGFAPAWAGMMRVFSQFGDELLSDPTHDREPRCLSGDRNPQYMDADGSTTTKRTDE